MFPLFLISLLQERFNLLNSLFESQIFTLRVSNLVQVLGISQGRVELDGGLA
jgi:hypothetical protein